MDFLTPEDRSARMSRIRGKDTTPELKLRKALWDAGLRYRKQYGRRKIDIAFPGRRVAVFVDGCFWHGCPLHGTVPDSNRGYWLPKLERNKQRDRENTAVLKDEGWTVIRVWEHELKEIGSVTSMIDGVVKGRDP